MVASTKSVTEIVPFKSIAVRPALASLSLKPSRRPRKDFGGFTPHRSNFPQLYIIVELQARKRIWVEWLNFLLAV
jgi:hypothetical protein